MDTLTTDPAAASAGGAGGAADDDATVLLSDGRRAVLHRHDPARDRRIDLLLLQAGYARGHLDMVSHAIFRTLLSIASIDGVPVAWPRPHKEALRHFARQFTTDDLDRLARCYDQLNPRLTPPQPWRYRSTGAGDRP